MTAPGGRRASWPLILAAGVALASCSDPIEPVTTENPLPFYWMEWPAAVTASAPGAMLFQSYFDFCSDPVIGFRTNNYQVVVESRAVSNNDPCPLRADLIPAFPRDTIVPLPVLTTAYGLPSYYEVRATLFTASGEIVERTAGTIRLDATPDTTRQVAGSGALRHENTCVVLDGGVPGGWFMADSLAHRYAVQNPPVFADTIYVMARGHVVPGTAPAGCSAPRLVHVDYLETVLLP